MITKNFLINLSNLFKWMKKLFISLTSLVGTLVVLFFIVVLFSLGKTADIAQPSITKSQIQKGDDDQQIAVVNLYGPILDGLSGDPFIASSDLVSSRKTVQVLKELEKLSNVKAVVLRINSPGGAVVASDEIYQQITTLESKKPVVASLGDVAASGGYYIAAPSTAIIANPSTITGSIGVFAQFPQFSGLYEKIGVKVRTIKSGEFKDIGSSQREMTKQEREIIQRIINNSYDQFVKAVALGREMSEAQVKDLADGRIYSGTDALENGLVDELGGFNDALLKAQQLAGISQPSVVEYKSQGIFESLLSSKLPSFFGIKINSLIPIKNQLGFYYLWDL
jgi:protease-4